MDYRLSKEAIEREWLTGLFSSVGREPAGPEALLLRMRERRTSALRNEISPSAPTTGDRRPKR